MVMAAVRGDGGGIGASGCRQSIGPWQRRESSALALRPAREPTENRGRVMPSQSKWRRNRPLARSPRHRRQHLRQQMRRRGERLNPGRLTRRKRERQYIIK